MRGNQRFFGSLENAYALRFKCMLFLPLRVVDEMLAFSDFVADATDSFSLPAFCRCRSRPSRLLALNVTRMLDVSKHTAN